jgi:hypothetical protein
LRSIHRVKAQASAWPIHRYPSGTSSQARVSSFESVSALLMPGALASRGRS